MFKRIVKKTFKTNVDVVPGVRDMLKKEIRKCIPLTKGGLSSKGLGIYGMIQTVGMNKSALHKVFYATSRLNLYNLNRLQKEIQTRDIKIETLDKILDHDYFYDGIKSIKVSGRTKMYDIEVEGHHSFECQSFVVHNSQGSTYQNVFVMEDDISESMYKSDIRTKNRILYTAYSRASEKLFILKK